MALKVAGLQSYFIYGGVQIPITKYTVSVDRRLVDTTDNTNYDQDANILFNSQLPVMANTTISVEGLFHIDITPIALMARLYSGVTAVPTVLGLNQGNLMGSGLFDIANFECQVQIDDTVKYTCTMASNGKFNSFS